jgi:hypothetical protein
MHGENKNGPCEDNLWSEVITMRIADFDFQVFHNLCIKLADINFAKRT